MFYSAILQSKFVVPLFRRIPITQTTPIHINAQDNLAAILYGINDLKLEQRPIPVPKDHQVLLKMEVVGICGTDVHFLEHGRIGPFVLTKPMVIGHEASGTVVKCGKDVKNLKEGDRVAIEPGRSCRMCDFCKNGRYNLCPDMIFCGAPPYDGNLSRFYVHDADFCYKLPPNMDFEDGTLMQPLSVGVHACKRGGVKFGDICFITGAGSIGLVTLLAAKAFGASKVLITDTLDVKLKKAQELGADKVLQVTKEMSKEQMVTEVRELLGEDPTVSFDCVGNETGLKAAIEVTKSGGVVVLVGMASLKMNISLEAPVMREVDIRGSFRFCNDYPTAIEMVKTGKIKVKPLITHHFRLEDTLKAFEAARTQEGNPVKILIHTNPDWKLSC